MPTDWHARRALTSLERFLRYCRFDPRTGCVLWTGGTTAGRGKTARYGAFKDGGSAVGGASVGGARRD